MLCSALNSRIRSWLLDYVKIQAFAVVLIYVQIGCSLIGSLGALYNGVLLINLAIALLALVAVESSSQNLARTYLVLLFCAILLDIFWFIFFAHEILNVSTEVHGAFVIFSVKLTLFMQIIAFSVRLLSSLLWIHMYRMGVSYTEYSDPREVDDLRNRFLNPTNSDVARTPSVCNDVLGGSAYNPMCYSSLFEDGKDDLDCLIEGDNYGIDTNRSVPPAESSLSTPHLDSSLQAEDITPLGAPL